MSAGGHKVPGCKGTWVDVTALTDPAPRELCTHCRAIRTTRTDYDESEIVTPPDRRGERNRSIVFWTSLALLLGLAAFYLGMTWSGR